MIQLHKQPLNNTEMPSQIQRLISDDLKNYIVIKDGHIIEKSLDESFNDLIVLDVAELTDAETMYYNSESVKSITADSVLYNYEETTSGLFIKAKRNKIYDDTLHVFYIQEEGEMNNNVMIVCEDNSDLKYFEYLEVLDKPVSTMYPMHLY